LIGRGHDLPEQGTPEPVQNQEHGEHADHPECDLRIMP
jgi:hypothetical protein